MAVPLVDRSPGDSIYSSDHNDVKDYIEDGSYRVNTLSLEVGGTEVISSGRVITNVIFGETFTAGENLVSGNLCYLKSDGKFWKADASADTTADKMLALCIEAINADADGSFLVQGKYTTTGLTAGAIQYVSETAGEITETIPTASGSIVRIVGYALSTTILYVYIDNTYIENN